MTAKIRIAPSVLSADFVNLASELEEVAAADFIHMDVMDGHFVPNLTFGPDYIRAAKRATTVPLDVHLMVDNPDESVDWYLDAGADMVTVHVEAARHLDRLIHHIQDRGAKAGVVLNPATPVCLIEDVVDIVDCVMLMSVNPGFGGQSFIENTIAKLERLRALCRDHGVDPLIEVDGGISSKTIGRVVAAGANLLVAGSAVFGAKDRAGAIADLRACAEAGLR